MRIMLSKVPEEMFIRVEQRYDIYTMLLERGGNVALTSHLTGEKLSETRQGVVKDYRFLDHRKIRLLGCRVDTPYRVCKVVNVEQRALYIPKGNKLELSSGDTVQVDRDSFVVAESTERIIPRADFHYCYVYGEDIEKVVKRIQLLGDSYRHRSKSKVSLAKDTPSGVDVSSELPKATQVRYKAIKRYMRQGKLIGFEIISQAGVTKRVKFNVAAELAKQNKIVNLVYSDGENTRAYFRGNGMTIEDIPIQEI